jgi:hypothetical protein
VIAFLHTSTTNKAEVVLNLFVQACVKLGLPSRVRCDHGGENIDVALFMTLVRGVDRASVIAGKSVHNQRIERLWRDVATQVTSVFYRLFYAMEDEGILDISNDMDMFALHWVFLPQINACMESFRRAWNSHRMRTERYRSPEQLWVEGMLKNANSRHTAAVEIFAESPSLEIRLEDALQRFQLDVQQFSTVYGREVPQFVHSVDTLTLEQIKASVVNVTDYRQQYMAVKQVLQVHDSS